MQLNDMQAEKIGHELERIANALEKLIDVIDSE